MLVCGIDEAGKGPVIGNLFVVGVVVTEDKLHTFKKIGVADSKLLSPEQREALFPQIVALAKGYLAISIPPEEIDDAVFGRQGLNLNWLEAHKTAQIINTLKPDTAIIDCPSPNIQAYRSYVMQRVQYPTTIIAEHKADANHLVVGAASIIAKVLRDHDIERLKQEFHVNFGSGYMSDPLTQKFLQEHHADFPFFRKSWSSWSDIKEKKLQKTLQGY